MPFYPPIHANGQMLNFPIGAFIADSYGATSIVSRYNKQQTDEYIASVISGASYGLYLDASTIYYNASGTQIRLDIIEGLRLAVSTAKGASVYATVMSGASTGDGSLQYLRLLSSGSGQAFSASNLSARLVQVTPVLAMDGSGVTNYISPLPLVSASNTWYQIMPPPGCLEVGLQASLPFTIGANSGASSGFMCMGAQLYKFPVGSDQPLYLRAGAANTTVQFYFVQTI